MKARTKRQWRLVGLLALCTGAIWVLWPTPLVYPLKIFVVMLHEISHGAAALVTGGRVERITLDPMQGGATYARGGNAFIMLSAGYLGSLLWGLLLIRLSRGATTRVRKSTMALGILLMLVSVAVVRGWFGLPFGLLVGLVLIFIGRRASVPFQRGVLLVLGVTSAMYALLDIRSDVLQRPGLRSDAFMLSELTGIPTIVWGIVWIGLGATACALALRNEFRRA
jgi:hypothetical protein